MFKLSQLLGEKGEGIDQGLIRCLIQHADPHLIQAPIQYVIQDSIQQSKRLGSRQGLHLCFAASPTFSALQAVLHTVGMMLTSYVAPTPKFAMRALDGLQDLSRKNFLDHRAASSSIGHDPAGNHFHVVNESCRGE